MRRACEVADPGNPPVFSTGWTNYSSCGASGRGHSAHKSSQVANFHRHKQMRQAESPAQQNKERRVRRAYEAADIKSPGTPPVYGTGWANFPWADRFMAVVPTRECIPLLYLLHYHKADVTSQTRVLLRQNDAIHCAHQISRAQDPKRRCPG